MVSTDSSGSNAFCSLLPSGHRKNKKGEDVPCQKYNFLSNPINGFKKSEGDQFLNQQFTGVYCEQGYVKRLRKSYDKRMN